MIPIIHMEYACLGEKGHFRLDELSEEDREHAVRVIIGYCSSSRSPFMHVVLSKATSIDKGAAERIVDDIYTSATRESYCAATRSHHWWPWSQMRSRD